MRSTGPTFSFACTKRKETENAILVVDPASGEEIWFPFSQVVSMHFHAKTGEGSIEVTEWIAKKKGVM